jgi:Surfeit locus protein 6
MDERDAAVTLKRKREAEADNSDAGVDSEMPLALQPTEKKAKRRKVEDTDTTSAGAATTAATKSISENDEEKRRRKAEQKAAKRERKQARQAKLKEKKDKLKQKKKDLKGGDSKTTKVRPTKKEQASNDEQSDSDSEDDDEAEAIQTDANMAENFSAIETNALDSRFTVSPSPAPESVLSPQIDSGASSISSMQPPSVTGEPQSITKPATLPVPTPVEHSAEDRAAAKERLATRLSELRAARKADDPEKKPGSRQELLDQRRRKEEAAKKAKKEQRRKEKEEELRKQEAEIAKRFSPGGSGSLLASPRSPMVEDSNFIFGRVAFGDGTQADATLSGILETKRRKGPADAATALQAAQNKAKRVSGYDANKREEIAEKDMWLNAKKKAHGERVRDDTSLLKKALKRQEGNKKKSETAWTNRVEGVQKGQEIRQKKRTENLKKRKDEKGGKSKPKKVKRPGFEGSFRGRTGGGKKKA